MGQRFTVDAPPDWDITSTDLIVELDSFTQSSLFGKSQEPTTEATRVDLCAADTNRVVETQEVVKGFTSGHVRFHRKSVILGRSYVAKWYGSKFVVFSQLLGESAPIKATSLDQKLKDITNNVTTSVVGTIASTSSSISSGRLERLESLVHELREEVMLLKDELKKRKNGDDLNADLTSKRTRLSGP